MIIRKSQAEIEGMARAGELVRETLQLVADHLEPGVSMLELDRIADEHIAERGAYPTSKGYKGFPNALCISPNSMVVHGIPNGYRAQEGDLISVDLGITLDGLVADSAITVPVGRDLAVGAAAARRLPGGACRRDRAGARRQSPLRHLPRRPDRGRGATASPSSGASSATASAARTTRTRRSRTTALPDAARCCRRG